MTARPHLQPHRRTRLRQLSIAALFSISIHAYAASANVDIAAQSLDQAILMLGKQSGENIAFPSDLASKLKAPAIKGNYSVEQALDILLKGSGLTMQKTPAGYSVVKDVEHKTETLPEVQVKGKVIQDKPAEYAGGQVARGGKIGLLGDKEMMDTPSAPPSTPLNLSQTSRHKTSAMCWSMTHLSGIPIHEVQDVMNSISVDLRCSITMPCSMVYMAFHLAIPAQ